MEKNLKLFREKIREKKMIEGALEVLQWDLETVAPKKGKENLAQIVGYLSMKEYELTTSKEFEDCVEILKENIEKLNEIEKKEIEELAEDIEKMKKIPPYEYQDYSELIARTQGIWEEAKIENNYEKYRDSLKKIVEYTIKFANYHKKDEKNLYDVILKDYEKGMTTEKLDEFFSMLKKEIVPLLKKIKEKGNPKKQLLQKTKIENQKKFNRFIGEYLGFDFDRGVGAESEHPFTMNITKNDVRLTTKYMEDNPMSAIFSTIHETGHGIYEQQIRDNLQGTILASGGSMGIHESQSRFYENILGRDIHFWKNIYKKAQEFMPFLEKISLEDFYKEINLVEPSLIRTEADELTYSLHIMVRYEIEKGLLTNELNIDDLPKIWKEKMNEYLGVIPTTDSEGIMQDVHWAAGLIGYFPSYALGSAYAAQIYNTMKKEIDVDNILETGELFKIKEWLGNKIHKYGKLKETPEIIKEVTGEELNPRYYIEYLKEKYTKIYNL
ncbi:carboxypeptidase M32 [uncultured Fusobacterium sp.]|uniref:carboxypeptidase M32 n=1 Tax=uncultured Fusobacterium sp. TaxID=159267 RepID=UPI0025F5BCD8|nr:carboxypeptidase M32 [uncultured Fusobacterium sp.]